MYVAGEMDKVEAKVEELLKKRSFELTDIDDTEDRLKDVTSKNGKAKTPKKKRAPKKAKTVAVDPEPKVADKIEPVDKTDNTDSGLREEMDPFSKTNQDRLKKADEPEAQEASPDVETAEAVTDVEEPEEQTTVDAGEAVGEDDEHGSYESDLHEYRTQIEAIKMIRAVRTLRDQFKGDRGLTAEQTTEVDTIASARESVIREAMS